MNDILELFISLKLKRERSNGMQTQRNVENKNENKKGKLAFRQFIYFSIRQSNLQQRSSPVPFKNVGQYGG